MELENELEMWKKGAVRVTKGWERIHKEDPVVLERGWDGIEEH